MSKFPIDRDVTVMGCLVSAEVQSGLLESMQSTPFAAYELEKKVAALGFPNRNAEPMRIADRLIQKYKKLGYIVFGTDRKWNVVAPASSKESAS